LDIEPVLEVSEEDLQSFVDMHGLQQAPLAALLISR
jgi:hypothetical protein